MEALLLLANFLGMVALLVWSDRAEKRGPQASRQGLFGYAEGEKEARRPSARPGKLRRR